VIAAALLLPIQPKAAQGQVGPFVVETRSFREESYPRVGMLRSVTSLQWKSPSGLTTYSLSDDGEYVVVSFRVDGEGGWCRSNPDPIRLTARPSVRFEIDCKLLGARKAKLLAGEMRAARPYFRAAYASFYEATLRQHGPLLQRCRQTTFGNHGQICATFWDEGRNATGQQMHKRTH
jgi:hypothetical protein